MTLAIGVTKAEDCVTMTLSGEVDTKTAPDLLQELTGLDLNALSQLRLKLAEVGFMSELLFLQNKKCLIVLAYISLEPQKSFKIPSQKLGWPKQSSW